MKTIQTLVLACTFTLGSVGVAVACEGHDKAPEAACGGGDCAKGSKDSAKKSAKRKGRKTATKADDTKKG